MTVRTLFNIILKTLGVFFLKDFLATLPQLLSVIIYLTKSDTVTEAIWMLVTSLLVLFVLAFVSYFLIFKTNMIIDKLQLDKSFDEETISLNVHRSRVLSISIIVLGGLIVADEIPNLCRHLFSYFQEKRMTYGQTTPSISYSVLSGSKIIIGLFLMAGQKQIVNLIERQRRK